MKQHQQNSYSDYKSEHYAVVFSIKMVNDDIKKPMNYLFSNTHFLFFLYMQLMNHKSTYKNPKQETINEALIEYSA